MNSRVIDPSRHPLDSGIPYDWASGWGQDRFGVWVEVTLTPTSLDKTRDGHLPTGEGLTQRLRWIPPGLFKMGSPEDEPGREEWGLNETRHEVLISQGFWLFDTPVTQALWEAVMGDNPSEFKSPDRPVEQVSWEDAQGFVERINVLIPGLNLCLPSEAQWEYACRAGTETALYTGSIEILGESNAPALDPIAWYGGNCGVEFKLENGVDTSGWKEKQYEFQKGGSHPVKMKAPNPWGLCDMLGNVWEWCLDGDREYAATDVPLEDPVGPLNGPQRVIRGGCWRGNAYGCRAAIRFSDEPSLRDVFLGFRCARVQP